MPLGDLDEMTTGGHIERPQTKKWEIIQYKLQEPKTTLKEISQRVKANYDYTRRVWSRFQRQRVTEKGEPLSPISVRPFFLWNQVPADWYLRCPVEASLNRNGQKVWRGGRVSFVVHRGGMVYVYPYFEGWEGELGAWLSGWVGRDGAEVFLGSLQPYGRHIAAYAPGFPRGVVFRIRGVGTFKMDRSPYPDGTVEYEGDPGFERRLRGVEKVLESVASSMARFGVAMEEHLKLIKSLQELVDEMRRMRQ